MRNQTRTTPIGVRCARGGVPARCRGAGPFRQHRSLAGAASTGLFTDVHLIRNVVVKTFRPLPQLDLVKQARQPLPPDLTVGSQVPYDFVVTNSGGTTIDDLAVNDPRTGPVTCPVSSLAPGETVTCTATYTVTAADVTHGSIDNTATVTGTSDGETITSPPSSESVPIELAPGIEIQTYLTLEIEAPHITVAKRVDSAGPYTVGSTVDYSYTVTNTGTLDLHDVVVQDDRVTSVTCDETTLAPGDSTTCDGSYTITQADIDACAEQSGGGRDCAISTWRKRPAPTRWATRSSARPLRPPSPSRRSPARRRSPASRANPESRASPASPAATTATAATHTATTATTNPRAARRAVIAGDRSGGSLWPVRP
ncbi:DUF7507 domain-containing protein [Streptomyces tendae]